MVKIVLISHKTAHVVKRVTTKFIWVFLITFTSNPVAIIINTISNSTKVYCFFCYNIPGFRFKFVKFRICASFFLLKEIFRSHAAAVLPLLPHFTLDWAFNRDV